MSVVVNQANPVDQLLELLRGCDRTFAAWRQTHLAQALGMKDQALSRIRRRGELTPASRTRIQEFILEQRRQSRIPDAYVARIEDLLAGRLWFDKAVLETERPAKTGWEHPGFPPIEREAWAWALSFRNGPLLDNLVARAALAGLKGRRVRDGIVLADATGRRQRPGGLFAEPGGTFCLRAGTVVLLGAARRHSHTIGMFMEFNRQLGKRGEVHVREFPDRPAYFGYPTVLKHLAVKQRQATKYYCPQRRVEGESLIYEDYVAIFHSPAKLILSGEHPFGSDVRHVVWLAALQRLANGIGVRLISESEFAAEQLRDYDFYAQRAGAIVIRVELAHDDRGDVLRSVDEVLRI